ncbi:MAG: hypothetical protein AB1486_29780 [Planctomycetota bacterium]
MKNSRRVDPRALHGLKAFRDEYPEADTCLLYTGTERLLVDGIPCVPLEEFLRALVPGDAWPVAR